MPDDFERCPVCMSVLLPKGDTFGLSPQQRQIYDAVKRFPRRTQELHDLLWPDTGKKRSPGDKAVHVIINQANERLREQGLRLRSIEGLYYIVAVEDAHPISESSGSPNVRRVGSRTKPARSARQHRGQ